jgi:hypothetical protein
MVAGRERYLRRTGTRSSSPTMALPPWTRSTPQPDLIVLIDAPRARRDRGVPPIRGQSSVPIVMPPREEEVDKLSA